MLWLYLHFPALQLDSLPPTEVPQAVACGSRHQLVQVNPTARDMGLKPGMGLALASSLCRTLEVHVYRESFGAIRLQEIAQRLYSKTAEIALFNPDGLLLKATPMLRYYGKITDYWQALKNELEAEKLQVSAATGYTPFAARLLARAGIQLLETCPDTLQNHWHKLSIAVSDLSPCAERQLTRIGVGSMAELVALPIHELSDRFDRNTVHYLRQLTGKTAHPVDFFVPPEYFTRHRELPCETATTQALIAPINQTLEALASFLHCRTHVTDEVTLTLHTHSGQTQTVSVKAGKGEASAQIWQRLTSIKLENVVLENPARAFTLSAALSYPSLPQSQDLFSLRQGGLTRSQLLAVLTAKLGQEILSQPALRDDHRPELNLACDPRGEPSHRKSLQLRPALVLNNPQTTTDHLAIMQGPERITTGWWDQRPVLRDYYIARNRQGRWLWIYRPLTNPKKKNSWYVHGYFS